MGFDLGLIIEDKLTEFSCSPGKFFRESAGIDIIVM